MPDLLELLGGDASWHRLPRIFGLLSLIDIRNELRAHNLFDTETPPFAEDRVAITSDQRGFRADDGTGNDLRFSRMGAVGTRFGRNFPLEQVHPDQANVLVPNPRTISSRLLGRKSFQPATTLNLLAAAWIQFQVHDWFAHKAGDGSQCHEVPIPPGDSWPQSPMRVPCTPAEQSPAGSLPTYANLNSHWWDGSQIYGSDSAVARKLRAGFGGRLKIGDAAILPLDVDGVELTGFSDNWWVGLSMLHALFVAEHNALCEQLAAEHPGWNDERLYRTARLINAALMAKIHTVEWTPAILPQPTVASAMHINWSGIVGEDLQEILKFLDKNDLIGGILGSPKNHHGVPYALTEEFAAVYRMHPLMPDEFDFLSLRTGRLLSRRTLTEISLKNTRSVMETIALRDLFYSFGVAHPGALRLHNFPNTLRALEKNGETIDLATIDVLRDRERGVPRYNQFRKGLRMKPVPTFEELTDNPEWAREIEAVYEGDINKVDLMVGMFAEPLIEGFGFSETAFRIFILMASRRLSSDRFFTDDFTPAIYTETGIRWIKENSMLTILRRHHPELDPALVGVTNAFQPWSRVS